MNQFYIGLICVGVLGCIVAILCFILFGPEYEAIYTQIVNFNNDTIVFYNVDWCPYCVNAKPAWSTFAKKMDSTMVNGRLLSAISLNPEKQSMIPSGFSVKGYPTIVLFRKNKPPVKFTNVITEKNLIDFVNTA
jgi:thiol-disulfide isomerase/thioredoxin